MWHCGACLPLQRDGVEFHWGWTARLAAVQPCVRASRLGEPRRRAPLVARARAGYARGDQMPIRIYKGTAQGVYEECLLPICTLHSWL